MLFYEGCCSEARKVVSSILKGSVLGPVLFLINLNHTTNRVLPTLKSFADDYKLCLWYKTVHMSAVAGVLFAVRSGLSQLCCSILEFEVVPR